MPRIAAAILDRLHGQPNGQPDAAQVGHHEPLGGVTVAAAKRLSNRWMFRGYFSLSNDQEFYDNPSLAIQDPTARAIAGAGSIQSTGHGASFVSRSSSSG